MRQRVETRDRETKTETTKYHAASLSKRWPDDLTLIKTSAEIAFLYEFNYITYLTNTVDMAHFYLNAFIRILKALKMVISCVISGENYQLPTKAKRSKTNFSGDKNGLSTVNTDPTKHFTRIATAKRTKHLYLYLYICGGREIAQRIYSRFFFLSFIYFM